MAVLVFVLHCSSFSYYTAGSEKLQIADEFIKYRLCMVAVPMFFTLSGMLFFRNYQVNDYLKKLKKRFKSLVIPYVSWNTINTLFAMITTLFLSQFFSGRQEFEWTFMSFFKGVFHYEYYLPFWFLFELIFFVVCTPVIELLTREKIASPFIIAGILLLCLYEYLVPYPLFRVPNTLVYYLIGAYIGRHWFELFSKKVSKKLSLLGVVMIVIAIISEYMSKLGFYGDFADTIDILNRIVYVWGFWWVIDLVVEKIKLRSFMDHTFMIYAIHVNVSAIIAKLIYYVLPKSSPMAFVNLILTTIISLVIIELITMFLNRFCKKPYQILTGSR